jgi:hypothetical protein
VLVVTRRAGMLTIAASVVVSRAMLQWDDSTWDILQLTLKTQLVVLVG